MVRPTAIRVSYEMFPTKNLDSRGFWRCIGGLDARKPAFISLTHGALGSGTDSNFELLQGMLDESTSPVAAHLTCGGRTALDLTRDLTALSSMGVRHIVALRGDAGSDSTDSSSLKYAEDLVQLAAKFGDFEISVAAYPETHPEAASDHADMENLKRKFDAGAERAITQFFFKAETFLRFRDKAQKQGIEHNLVPGILPIGDFSKVASFSERCGTSIPDSIAKRFDELKSDPSGAADYAHELIAGMCDKLLIEGVEDFHFYTLNKFELSLAITDRLQAIMPAAAVA